jgi:WD40 repeat protein
VANVFISHNSSDVGWAERIHQWLSEDGHKVFLDSDKDDGVAAGEEWRPRLYERLRWADAVICLVSPTFLTSRWCAFEIGAAQALGSEILPVRVSSESLDDGLLTTKQYVDVVRDASYARDRLRARLSIIDGTGGRGWPDDASPYPGLRPFQLGEHLVFFGRGREIKEITERLRSPAERGERAVLTVVGPSGCGKSSLVRAGLVPRIAGGDEWLTVPPIVPGSDPMGNLVRAIASLVRERHIDFDLASLRTNLQHSGLKAVATDLLVAAQADSQCKLLIVIDQFEELLTQTEARGRAEFVATIQPTLGGPVQALATMRPEFLDPASKDADLSKLPPRIQPVRPLAADALREVIERPAGVAGLGFDDDLVTRLVTDTGSGDALPLLAFTLEQLADGVRRGGRLTHQRYDEIGGVQGALQRQADAALEEACSKAGATRAQVISALLDLVTINAEGRPTKRRAVLDELSSTMVDKLEPFVDRRLLSTEAEGERTVVSVAHEAFLVNWKPLKDEIDAQQIALRARRVVENEAADWMAGGREAGLLLQGGKLTKAIVDTGAELEPVRDSVGGQTSGPKRLRLPGLGSRQRRLITRVELNDEGRQFLEASIRTDRTRRRRRRTQLAAVIAILALVAGAAVVGFIQASNANNQAQARLRESTALRLVSEGQAMLANIREGSDARALNQILAARKIAVKPDESAVLTALQTTASQLKIIDTYADVSEISISTDGQQIISEDGDTLTFRDIHTGLVTATTSAYAFSTNGSRVVAITDDRTLKVRDTHTGQQVGPAITPNKDGGVSTVMRFSPDAHKIVFNQWPEFLYLWDIETGNVVPMTGLPEGGGIWAVAFTPDGRRVVTSGEDGVIRVWDAQSGRQLSQPISRHDTARAIAVSRDGRLITGEFNTVRVWNLDSGQPVGQPRPDPEYSGDSIESIALSRDGRRIVAGSTDHTIQLWDAETADPIGKPIRGHRDDVKAVAFSADGQQIISGSSDKTIRIWNTEPSLTLGKPVGDLHPDVAISPDGRRIVGYGYTEHGYTIGVRDVQTLKPVFPPLVQKADALAFSRDGSRIATLNATTVTIWDANTGARLDEWNTGHKLEPPFGGIIFSPDGKKIATFVGTVANIGRPKQIEDAALTVWDANSGGQMVWSTDHIDIVRSAAFSPDSRQLVYSSGRNRNLSTCLRHRSAEFTEWPPRCCRAG